VEVTNALSRELERSAVCDRQPVGGCGQGPRFEHEALVWCRRPAIKARSVCAKSLVAIGRHLSADLRDSSALLREVGQIQPPAR
jgi:adenine-specific DNA methylase